LKITIIWHNELLMVKD